MGEWLKVSILLSLVFWEFRWVGHGVDAEPLS